jgi:quercetin dioxygenase-like cupin family protein/DNA-binding MarR family transcriptional regulator
MSHLPVAAARVVETPAATMRTYASPTTEHRAPVAVWRTEMTPGATGPLHVVDVDQVVVVVSGRLTAEVGGTAFVVPTGDCALLPADAERRQTAGPDGRVTVTASLPGSTARVGAGDPVPVPWASWASGQPGCRSACILPRLFGMDDVPLVRLLSMAVTVALESLHEELARAGHPDLRPAHGYALHAVSTGVDTASSLGPLLGMSKQGAAKLLQTLVEGGYIEIGTATDDARRKPLVLTERGRSAVASSVAIQQDIERRWAETVGSRRMDTVRAALQEAVRTESGGALPPVRPAW